MARIFIGVLARGEIFNKLIDSRLLNTRDGPCDIKSMAESWPLKIFKLTTKSKAMLTFYVSFVPVHRAVAVQYPKHQRINSIQCRKSRSLRASAYWDNPDTEHHVSARQE